MDLLTALPLPPLTLLFLLAMCFLAGFVDAVAGGDGLISLPAFLACGLPSHVAFACNKCQSAISALIGLAIGAYDGLVGPGTGRSRSSRSTWRCAMTSRARVATPR